jgi:hypothetical protein
LFQLLLNGSKICYKIYYIPFTNVNLQFIPYLNRKLRNRFHHESDKSCCAGMFVLVYLFVNGASYVAFDERMMYYLPISIYLSTKLWMYYTWIQVYTSTGTFDLIC